MRNRFLNLQSLPNEDDMKRKTLTSIQPFMRKICSALSADLPSVLKKLGYELIKDSERGWRIPGYGGLIVWRRDDQTWGWNHFSSGRSGDAISFLTHCHEMSRKEAVETLTSYGCSCVVKTNSTTTRSRIDLRKPRIPPLSWIENASKLVDISQNKLWSNRELMVWKWLRGRGLQDKTIRNGRLGWIKDDVYFRREKWGLPTENEGPKKILLPRGLLIPAGDIFRIRVRRFSEDSRRYHTLAGSSSSSFVIGDPGKPVVLVESDLDAWLIHQEAGEAIAVASIGSAGGKPDIHLSVYLVTAPKILISLDSDKAGWSAGKWWIKNFSKAKLWPVPWGKDPSDAFSIEPTLIKKWIGSGI
jgi:hypothetical protein